MSKSLIEQLPRIVARARHRVAALLAGAAPRPRGRAAAQLNTIAVVGHTGGGTPGNRLIEGDNLCAMVALLAGDAQAPSLRGRIDLIYIDPPFASDADYHARVNMPPVTSGAWPEVITTLAYRDRWDDGLAGFLAMLAPRLLLMRELLAPTGSIYVHLDGHAGHYVKLLLDEIFGRAQFRNEIVWHYSGWNKRLRHAFERRHDLIYAYARGDAQYFASYSEPWPSRDAYLARRRQKLQVDADGEEYVLSDAGKGRRIKRYLRDAMREGVAVDDVWHLDKLNHSAAETVGYDTQKPEALLERIVTAACPPGGLVADFNGGSGTTAAVADRLERRWISVDIGASACMLSERRLLSQQAHPYLRQCIGKPQTAAASLSFAPPQRRDAGYDELLIIVLRGYRPAGTAGTDARDERAALDLIQYWYIDPDYDGECFRARWHAARGVRAIRVATDAVLAVPALIGPRRIAVRAVDAFGRACQAELTAPFVQSSQYEVNDERAGLAYAL